MEILRTPDECFADLPGYPYAPKHAPVDDAHDLRMHYVDEGPRDGVTVLMLHGEPTWSYLYRSMIPIFAEAGYRAVAPDLIGFGRSDKPAAREDHTYQRHVDWTAAFVAHIAPARQLVLVCQDWGGLIGLRLVAADPERFAAVVATNTFLPTGHEPLPEAFHQWQAYAQSAEELPVGDIVQRGTIRRLHENVRAAYDAPFPDASYQAAARQFPALVPTDPASPDAEANQRAWAELERYDRPFATAFSDRDPITAGADRLLQERIPGAKRCRNTTLAGAGHFVQEDRGPELAGLVLALAGGL